MSEITPDIVAEHGLTPSEYETIVEAMGRTPNLTELRKSTIRLIMGLPAVRATTLASMVSFAADIYLVKIITSVSYFVTP